MVPRPPFLISRIFIRTPSFGSMNHSLSNLTKINIPLIHWILLTLICVSQRIRHWLSHGLSTVHNQAVTWANFTLLSIWPFRKSLTFLESKCIRECRLQNVPLCSGVNVLIINLITTILGNRIYPVNWNCSEKLSIHWVSFISLLIKCESVHPSRPYI